MSEDLIWLKGHVFDTKGTLQFIYDYHSSSWTGIRLGKRGELIAHTTTVEGEGQGSIEMAAKELRRILGTR